MTEDERKAIQMAYIRVCRDSGWRMDYIQAAHFTAKLLGMTAFDIWFTLDLQTMQKIAKGEHPVKDNPEYDNRRVKP